MQTIYVLDTNAYRNIVHTYAFEEVCKYKLHGDICFSVVTAIELLRHLEFDDKAYNDCRKALYLLVNNTMHEECGNLVVSNVLPNIFTFLSYYFFITVNEDKLGEKIIHISYNITKEYFISEQSLIISEIKTYYDWVIETLIDNVQNYFDDMFLKKNTSWDSVFKDKDRRKDFNKNLNSGRFHKYVAEALVRSVVKESEKEKFANIEIFDKFQLDFSVSIDFFVQKILRLLTASSEAINKLSEIAKDRENKKPKWNSFSDMQLIAGVEYLNSKEDNAIFVTDDQDIIRSFKNADKERFVITLKEYLNKLEPYK